MKKPGYQLFCRPFFIFHPPPNTKARLNRAKDPPEPRQRPPEPRQKLAKDAGSQPHLNPRHAVDPSARPSSFVPFAALGNIGRTRARPLLERSFLERALLTRPLTRNFIPGCLTDSPKRPLQSLLFLPLPHPRDLITAPNQSFVKKFFGHFFIFGFF
jgi:hypothetical protein